MSRLTVATPNKMSATGEILTQDFAQRIMASPPGVCPVDLQLASLQLCHAQTCGKCTPCRIGLGQLEELLLEVREGRGTIETLKLIEKTAKNIEASADCAIGFQAARLVLKGLDGFREDYISHVTGKGCISNFEQPIPCVELCPAHVDIPGYIALAGAGRTADAIRLIRKDNPFPTACALICEHPCENRCRRNMIDTSINIRVMKKYAVDTTPADTVPAPENAAPTGKKIAIIGAGPSGLSAAYYLQLMGHEVTVFEEKKKLGGMLRYGIPNYRFPRERLQEDIDIILSTGIKVKMNTCIGKDIGMEELEKEFDAIYVAIGAHTAKRLKIEGENSNNVISAVDWLRKIGDDEYPDFTGKKVVVVGGGNVAMDCARTAIRAKAEKVSLVYRRRKEDMTAMAEEIEGALSEGVEILTLFAPIRIDADENGNATGLIVQPQMIGPVSKGRPAPVKANKPEEKIEADVILVAIGQDIVSEPFVSAGMPARRKRFVATPALTVEEKPGLFVGGDCMTGPASVIMAISAGKVAAANIDKYLGFQHEIKCDVEIPNPLLNNKVACGRVNLSEREAAERKYDFDGIENSISEEEACQEASRCLRCDHFGCGALRGGRVDRW